MGLFGTQRGNVGHRIAMSVAAVCALTVGCSDSNVKVNNDNPLGTVGGLVVDVATQAALSGVTVTLLSGGGTFNATSGTDGFYKLESVPSGTFTLELSKDTYMPIRIQGNLAGAVGNFPITSPVTTVNPYGMVPVGPDFIVRVVDYNGVAVTGATASARAPYSFADLSSGTPEFHGNTSVAATTAADGRLVFKGLPDAAKLGGIGAVFDPLFGPQFSDSVQVTLAPIAVTGQENYQYFGGTFTFRTLSVGSSIPQIVMAGPTSALTVLETNLEWLRDGFVAPNTGAPINGSLVDTAGPITIAFSEAVDPATLRATVTTESGAPGPALTPTVNLNLVSLAGTFTAGVRYNLYLEASAILNPSAPGRQFNRAVPFFGRPASGSKPTIVSAKLNPTSIAPPGVQSVTFTLSEPIGIGDGATELFDCALFYEAANFDGSTAGQANVQGEWSTDPAQLTCNTVSPVAGVSPNGGALLLGRIVGTENLNNTIGGAPITGFASTFTATIGSYVVTATPAMPAPSASVPAATTGKGHLYFSNQPRTVRRVNGEPVGQIDFTLQ